MKTNILLTLALLIFGTVAAFGQTTALNSQLSTPDTADLRILSIFPEEFPDVSVVFRAERRSGEPVWDLTREKMQVTENGETCKVLSLEQLSRKRAINLGIVIDHSGSMLVDDSQLFGPNGAWLVTLDADFNLVYPKGYKSPIDRAKAAVKQFVEGFDSKKDFISIIGFSTLVDRRLSLTHDLRRVHEVVDSMQADWDTALYDAMLAGLAEVIKGEGLKVLIALTDGQDNVSVSSWSDVVDFAKVHEIPVYIIGLGNANQDTLKMIAQGTNGQFFYTRSSGSLDDVYTTIRKKVQAFYELVYRSENLASADSLRTVEIRFENDSLALNTQSADTRLPAEVLAVLQQKEKERQYLLFGGVLAVLALGAVVLVYRYRGGNRQPTPTKTLKIFPNPSIGWVTATIEGGDWEPGDLVQITGINGQLVKTIPLSGAENRLNLSALPEGQYVFTLLSGGIPSPGVSLVLQP